MVAEGHGDRVLQLRAAHLDHFAELHGLLGERRAEHFHRPDQVPAGQDGGHVHRRRVGVVGRLAQVHMVVGVQVAVVAACVAQKFQRAVGDDLVRVHVRRCAGAALDHIHHKRLVQLPGDDLPAGGDDRPGALVVEQAQFLVGRGGGGLDHGQRPDQVHVGAQRLAGDREILHGTQRVHAPVGVIGDLAVADQVVFGAHG
jgi:hypothetical protein